MLALIVGFVLLSVAVLRAGVLPRWAAILLVVGSLAMLGFNDQIFDRGEQLMVKRHAPVGRIFVAAWVVLVVGGSVLAFAARGAGLLPGDLALTRSLQKLPPDSALGTLLSYAGEVVWFLAIAALAVALLMSRWLAALFILLASLTSVFIGEALKLLVASPRPSAELVRVVDPQQGHGFPSSTALLSVVLLGMIVYLIWQPRRSVAVVAMGISPLMVLLIGLSRVYVGEHWATDVVGGWLFGGAWLLVLVAAHRWWVFRRAKS